MYDGQISVHETLSSATFMGDCENRANYSV